MSQVLLEAEETLTGFALHLEDDHLRWASRCCGAWMIDGVGTNKKCSGCGTDTFDTHYQAVVDVSYDYYVTLGIRGGWNLDPWLKTWTGLSNAQIIIEYPHIS